MSRSNPAALQTADAIADRLRDPARVYGAHEKGRRRPQSLAGGAAGIALLHIERARTGHADWATARTWLATAARDDLSIGTNANLFFGAPTLTVVTHAAADEPGKYRTALAGLDQAVIHLTQQRIDAAHARISRRCRPNLDEFDVIRGLAGLGRIHLLRHPDHDITREVLVYLVRLTQPLPSDRDGLPGWWTDVSPNGAAHPDFPGGHGNLGLSHGITGPLVVLSLALRAGIAVPGLAEAIHTICAWLDAWQQRDPSGPWWPGYIARAQLHQGKIQPTHRQRPSWCYGTPGVARALYLAGIALGDPVRQQIAVTALLGCLRDRAQLSQLRDIGLCHGVAGALQAVHRTVTDHANRQGADPGTTELADVRAQLTRTLLTYLQSTDTDDPEFLDGLAGVGLALHAAVTGGPPISGWDRCLLLA
jgi:hypothetical protein